MTQKLAGVKLADLHRGDRITALGGIAYNPPRTVRRALGPVFPGSPVVGVELVNPDRRSSLTPMLYPDEVGRLLLTVERDDEPVSRRCEECGAEPSQPCRWHCTARP